MKASYRQKLMDIAERRVWWSLGINPDDSADWPLMSNLAGNSAIQRMIQNEFDSLRTRQ